MPSDFGEVSDEDHALQTLTQKCLMLGMMRRKQDRDLFGSCSNSIILVQSGYAIAQVLMTKKGLFP